LARFAALAAGSKLAAEAAEGVIKEHVAEVAESLVAVDTGETKDSIEITDEGVQAGGAALYLEFGTYKMSAQPFLTPAAESAPAAEVQAGEAFSEAWL
jgi:hypothetical protein